MGVEVDNMYSHHDGRGSSGVAKAGLVTGIVGAAGWLLNGGLGGLGGLGRGGCATPVTGCCETAWETREAACLRADNAALRAERYADAVGINTFKEAIALSNKNDDKINANQKEVFQALAALDKRAAVNEERIDCLRKETQAAIALESERREAGDKNLYCYVNATFVPGKLNMPLSSICPPAMPASTTPPAQTVA